MGVTSFLAAGAIAVIATGEFDRAATAQGRGVWQPWSEEAVRASPLPKAARLRRLHRRLVRHLSGQQGRGS